MIAGDHTITSPEAFYDSASPAGSTRRALCARAAPGRATVLFLTSGWAQASSPRCQADRSAKAKHAGPNGTARASPTWMFAIWTPLSSRGAQPRRRPRRTGRQRAQRRRHHRLWAAGSRRRDGPRPAGASTRQFRIRMADLPTLPGVWDCRGRVHHRPVRATPPRWASMCACPNTSPLPRKSCFGKPRPAAACWWLSRRRRSTSSTLHVRSQAVLAGDRRSRRG